MSGGIIMGRRKPPAYVINMMRTILHYNIPIYFKKNSEYLHEIYYNYHKIIKEWRIL